MRFERIFQAIIAAFMIAIGAAAWSTYKTVNDLKKDFTYITENMQKIDVNEARINSVEKSLSLLQQRVNVTEQFSKYMKQFMELNSRDHIQIMRDITAIQSDVKWLRERGK